MRAFGLNHMTTRNASAAELLHLAGTLGCVGIELRNDLTVPFLDGETPAAFKKRTKAANMRVLALAEVYGFNDGSERALKDVDALAKTAAALGAEAIALIPFIADTPLERSFQQSAIASALAAIRPILEAHGIAGLIEPLGFANASLRFKADVVQALETMGTPACIGLIHDTFHHALAGETEVFATATRIVHISGVTRKAADLANLTDLDRGLVGAGDVLGNIDQIAQLDADGFAGVYSFEAFAPAVHDLKYPKAALSASLDFMSDHLAKLAA